MDTAMSETLLSPTYELLHPDFALNLMTLLRRYILSKPPAERLTTEFITEVRRRLYLVHSYNCEVIRLYEDYPHFEELEILLTQYVEFEFNNLYHNIPKPSLRVENVVEQRVFILLQVILNKALLTNDPFISKCTDVVLKNGVLKILSKLKPSYLTENRFIGNMARKLLITTFKDEYYSYLPVQKYLRKKFRPKSCTSDYGSDESDSDWSNPYTLPREIEESSQNTASPTAMPTNENTENNQNNDPNQLRAAGSSECVIIESDSESENNPNNAVVTFEMLEDSDSDEHASNFMMYLHKEFETNSRGKNKFNPGEVIVCSDSEEEESEEERAATDAEDETAELLPVETPEIMPDCIQTCVPPMATTLLNITGRSFLVNGMIYSQEPINSDMALASAVVILNKIRQGVNNNSDSSQDASGDVNLNGIDEISDLKQDCMYNDKLTEELSDPSDFSPLDLSYDAAVEHADNSDNSSDSGYPVENNTGSPLKKLTESHETSINSHSTSELKMDAASKRTCSDDDGQSIKKRRFE